jgi:hypothetical protein
MKALSLLVGYCILLSCCIGSRTAAEYHGKRRLAAGSRINRLDAYTSLDQGSQPSFRQSPGTHRKTICTKGIPPILNPLGISDICLDIDVQGCGTALNFAVRFASQNPGGPYLFDQQIVRTSTLGGACIWMLCCAHFAG